MNPCRRTPHWFPCDPYMRGILAFTRTHREPAARAAGPGLVTSSDFVEPATKGLLAVGHASNCFGAYCVSSSWCSQYPREATGPCVLRCVPPSAALLAALPHTELTLSTVVPESVAITNCDATSTRSGNHLLRYELDQVTVNGRVAAR